MSLCKECATIDLEFIRAGRWSHQSPVTWEGQTDHALKDSQEMLLSAQGGCQGCQFFSEIIKQACEDSADSENFAQEARKISIAAGGEEYQLVYQMEAVGRAVRRIGMDLCFASAELDWGYNPSDKGPFRPIPQDPTSETCLNMAKSWLRKCSGHSRCQKIAEVTLPTRLIKVPSNKDLNPRLHLTKPGERGRYLTLSHCWGSGINFVLRTSNVAEFQQSIDSERLPQSFKDAIIITRRLGFRYIWIDALCIIQDDDQDWARQSSLMAKVYRNGALMLSALGASDSEKGLLRPRNVPRSHCFGKKQEFVWQAKTEWTSELITSPKPLDKRAWAYQERVMAPRILHFAEKKLLWECADGQWTEDAGLTRVAYPHNEKPRIERFLRHFGTPESENRVPVKALRLRRRLLAYYECVNNYTKRILTKDTDKLPAFSGLASAFRIPELGEYLAGLWQNDLVYELDWRINNDTENSPCSGPDSMAPSWSWASVSAVCSFNPMREMMKHAYTRDKWTAEYGNWLETQAPSLLSYNYQLQTADIHGRVSNASITLRGYFRSIIVQTGEGMAWSGIPAELDKGSRNGYPWRFASPHEWDPSPSFNWPRNGEIQVKDLVALQIGMTAYGRMAQQLELVMLILEPVDGRDNTFRRIGRLELRMPPEEVALGKWKLGEVTII